MKCATHLLTSSTAYNLVHVVLQEKWTWPIRDDAQGPNEKQCSLVDLPSVYLKQI